MRLLTNNMIGRYIPFFLHNLPENRSYYLYQIFSPGLSPNGFPWVSMTKISERTYNDKEPCGISDSDVLAWAMGLNGSKIKVFPERGLKYLRNCYKNFPSEIQFEGIKFPRLEMDPYSQNTQRNLIISLRDSIRYGRYKFEDGYEVDVLFSPSSYITFTINKTEDIVKLTPKNLYMIKDVEMKNPMPIPSSITLDSITSKEFKESPNKKYPSLCRALKEFEWESFDRKFKP